MKLIRTNLLNDVSGGAYNQTKTIIRGNVHSKTINSKNYLGPALNRWIDVFVDSTITPVGFYCSPNGRIFVASTKTSTTVSIAAYSFNFSTGASTYLGRITINIADTAATTHVTRALKVQDNGTTNWKIFLATTGSVAINGGLYMVNKVDLADFTFVGTNFPFATSTDQKATYFLQDPANVGVNQLNVAAVGAALDLVSNKIYVHNGISATHQYYVYDTASAPTYITGAISVSVGSPGIVSHAGHTFAVNDPVVFTAGTLPTGLTVGTVYFVRSPIPGVSYQLSATSGGASINTTGSPSSGAFIGRAFGTSTSNFLHKTGNLPALSGTLISNNSEYYAVPGHTINAGFACAFFGTTTTMYLGKLSELTSGTTTWPSLINVNNNADSSVTTQNARAYVWSNSLDRAIVNTTSSVRFLLKQFVNNSADRIFGRTNISVYEAQNPQVVYLGTNAEANIVDISSREGWLFMASNAVGQRGITAVDLRSDSLFDYSYIITPVKSVTPSSILKFVSRVRALDLQTDSISVSYRTSGFGVENSGWTALTSFDEYSVPITSGQIQFKINFDSLSKEAKTLHAQINELLFAIEDSSEISDNWEFSDDYSDNNSPSRCAFRLKLAYTSAVPTLYFRALDLSNALLVNHNTLANPGNFEYSTDNGTTWLPLGTIPNTVGTLVRYTFTSPPGVDIRPGLKES
jgi:hypothetical protein